MTRDSYSTPCHPSEGWDPAPLRINILLFFVQSYVTTIPTLTYFQKGAQPALLIHSGTHGDEYGVIESVKKYLEKNESRLPDFIWVPEVSPTAVAARTRRNAQGNDLNRAFVRDASDREAVANLNIINAYSFKYFISFHEDLEFPDFYMYDSVDARETESFRKFYEGIRADGVGVHNGLDDANDPALGFEIQNCYFSYQWITGQSRKESGTVWEYLKQHQPQIKRMLNPEIPGNASQKIKDALVKQIFKNFFS